MRAVFLDRDGTITKDGGYAYKQDQLDMIDNLAAAIKIFNKNFLVIIITNQPVIARGLCTEDDVRKMHDKIISDLAREGARIDGVYFCPHHPEHHEDVPEHARKYRVECDCRKPEIGLIKEAARDFDIDLERSFFVGDSTRDILAAKKSGCTSILVKTGHGGRDGKYEVVPDYNCEDLHEAAELIDALSNTGAVILAGGRGERMRPLTDTLPKPMLPLKGRPIMEHQINLLKRCGIKDVVVCGYYLFDKIRDYFGDGSKFGVNISYIEEETPLGTGGAVRNAAAHIKWDNFVLLNADIATNANLGNLVKFHLAKRSLATPLLRITDHPFDSDAMEVDGESRVVNFVGKHQESVKTCNVGIMMLSKDFLRYIPEGVSNIEKDGLSKAVPAGNVYGYVSGEYFKDVGTIERYEKAEKEFVV